MVFDLLLDGVLRLLLRCVDVRRVRKLQHSAGRVAHLPGHQALEVVDAELDDLVAVVLREGDGQLADGDGGGGAPPAPGGGDVGAGELGRLVVQLVAPVLGVYQRLPGAVHEQAVEIGRRLVVVGLGRFTTTDDDDAVLGQLVVQGGVGDGGEHDGRVHGHNDLGLSPVAGGIGWGERALALEERGVARARVLRRSLVGPRAVESDERAPVVLPSFVDLGVEGPQGLTSLLRGRRQTLGGQDGVDLRVALARVHDVVDVGGVDAGHRVAAVVAPVPDGHAGRHVDVAPGSDLASVLVAVTEVGSGGRSGAVRRPHTAGHAAGCAPSRRPGRGPAGRRAGGGRSARSRLEPAVRSCGGAAWPHAGSRGHRRSRLRSLRRRHRDQQHLYGAQRDERQVAAPQRAWRHSHLTPPTMCG